MAASGSSVSGWRNEYAGTAQGGDVIVDYYGRRSFTNAYGDFLEKTVTLRDGETGYISLTTGHPSLLFFLVPVTAGWIFMGATIFWIYGNKFYGRK